MSTLYVGDVHGCAEELSELLAQVQASEVVLLGDLFTRGPDPMGVWRLLEQYRPYVVMGNHDAWLLRQLELGRELKGSLAALNPVVGEVQAYLKKLPNFLMGHGRIAVHGGIHPELGWLGTPAQMAQNLRRFPDDRDPNNPFWYDAGWAGPEAVIFGHDAVRGLVRRERAGRLLALGLDTGCVYGRCLTGWIAEEDQLVQIPAHKVWYEWQVKAPPS